MEAAIDRCCDLKTLEDNWSEILNIADTYAVAQPKKCLKCIIGKIFQPNPNISLKAITLLDACVKNAGNTFARELSSKDFVSNFKQKYPKLQEKPRMKLLELTRQWANDYKSNPEFNLLTTIYMWVQHEYPHDITALKTTQNIAKKLQKKAADRDLRAKEEEDIAKAIALSLNDTKNSASQNQQKGQPEPSSSSSTYPSVYSPPTAVNGKKELGCVRALFDFEAAEDNELTFKAGDIITLVDDSDPNWWKGSNHNGEGLFPAQFVSRDLNSGGNEAEVLNKREKVEQVTSQKPVRIDPQLVDNCLEMLGDADTTGVARPDPEDLPIMEQQCRDMEPLIEAELEGVYTRISEVDALKQRLAEALTQYHELVTNRVMPAQPQPPQVFQPTTTATTTSSSFANPAFNPPAQFTLPPVAYPQPMMYQPGPPPTNPPYQPNHVPPPMPPFAPAAAVAAPVPVPAGGGGGAPAMYGAPMPVYGHQAAYGYPMDLNAWQQQPMPTQQPMQHPLPPQHMQPPAVVYGAPSANPSASTYNVG